MNILEWAFVLGAAGAFLIFFIIPMFGGMAEDSKTVERAAKALSDGDEVDPAVHNQLIGFITAALVVGFLFLLLRSG